MASMLSFGMQNLSNQSDHGGILWLAFCFVAFELYTPSEILGRA